VVKRSQRYPMPYQNIIAYYNTPLILETTARVNKHIFTHGDIFPKIRIKRRKQAKRLIYVFSDKPGKNPANHFRFVVRAVQFRCNTHCFIGVLPEELICLFISNKRLARVEML
jgi:hypothetical protein